MLMMHGRRTLQRWQMGWAMARHTYNWTSVGGEEDDAGAYKQSIGAHQ